MLLRETLRLLHVQRELLFAVRGVHDQKGNEKHALVAALQIFQQFLGLAAISRQIRGKNVHIIAGTDGLFLFFNLHFIQVGDFPLNVLDGGGLVNSPHMEADHK